MFELIRENKRRSAMLMGLMLVVLLAVGFSLGAAFFPPTISDDLTGGVSGGTGGINLGGGLIGLGIAFVIWGVQALVAFSQGDSILMAVSGARKIEKQDHPQLFNVVEEMSIAAALPKMPDVYLIDDPALNAFAAGRGEKTAKVAITTGLLARLNRDQLQGVMAHEIAHIKHRDVLFMTMAGIMLGTIVMLSEVFLRGMFYGAATGRRYSGGNRRGGGGGGGAAQIVVVIVAVVLAILAPLLAQLLYFAISRRREYLADAGAAVYTRYPEGIASALEVLQRDTHRLQNANKATAPMYIINPLHKEGAMALNLTSTHPPIDERVKILRSLGGGVSFAKYQQAFNRVRGKGGLVPKAALHDDQELAVRDASPEGALQGGKPDESALDRLHQAGDALRNHSGFIFLPCACGMRVKLPPEYKRPNLTCPRCKQTLAVPAATLAGVEALTQMGEGGGIPGLGGGAMPGVAPAKIRTARPRKAKQDRSPVTVRRVPGEWQSVRCPCGAIKNIAPTFEGDRTVCTRCERPILLTP